MSTSKSEKEQQKERYAKFQERHNVTAFDPSYIPVPDKWLVEDLFLTGGQLNFVAGEPKAGKSRLVRWIVAHLLSDKDPFELKSDAGVKRVLWYGAEERYDRFFANLVRYGELIGADTSDWKERLVHIESAGMGIEFMTNRNGLLASIRENNADLVILDSFRGFHSTEEKGGPALSAILNSFRRWTTVDKFDMIILHHTGKIGFDADRGKSSTWLRGSSEIAAIMDCMVGIERVGKELNNKGSMVNLHRFGRHGPGSAKWVIEDLGRSDKNQPAASDLGWRLDKKEE